MAIEVLLFGQLSEITGADKLTVTKASSTVELVQVLHKQFPNLALANYKLAVNKVLTEGNTVLKDADVVALLPPFSGG
ncbi:MAG: MoaD/ThiS family protein [bacterium]|nr:MoaD/ThiS family protein [bacterium]